MRRHTAKRAVASGVPLPPADRAEIEALIIEDDEPVDSTFAEKLQHLRVAYPDDTMFIDTKWNGVGLDRQHHGDSFARVPKGPTQFSTVIATRKLAEEANR